MVWCGVVWHGVVCGGVGCVVWCGVLWPVWLVWCDVVVAVLCVVVSGLLWIVVATMLCENMQKCVPTCNITGLQLMQWNGNASSKDERFKVVSNIKILNSETVYLKKI